MRVSIEYEITLVLFESLNTTIGMHPSIYIA